MTIFFIFTTYVMATVVVVPVVFTVAPMLVSPACLLKWKSKLISDGWYLMAFEPAVSSFMLVKSLQDKKIYGVKFPITEKNQTDTFIWPFFKTLCKPWPLFMLDKRRHKIVTFVPIVKNHLYTNKYTNNNLPVNF